ncbi:unnamed protein product [Urochloa humidicola]
MVEGLISFVYDGGSRSEGERGGRRSTSASAPAALLQHRGGRSERFTSAAYDGGRSQSCRFVARPPAYDLDLSHGERPRLGVRAPPPEGLPENKLLPPAGDGRRLSSRSRRFSSMRLFACVSGA